ncbi:MAG TPA: dicarboxylate/amino acid:cation symporter [Ignavibacteriaceae bacterium]|nr:dicarboxylate/amino acid:cation symporter [Ignavibacteriaceae bacterium]
MPKKSLPLHTKIFIGLFTGLVLGLFCNIFFKDNENIEWIVKNIAYPAGQIFLRMIFMVVIPLIFTAIVLGVADFRDIRKVGRIGFKTLGFTLIITAVSVLIGLTIVNIVQPGKGISVDDRNSLISTLTAQPAAGLVKNAEESKTFIEIIVDLIPRNPFVEIVNAFDPNYNGGGLLALMFFSLLFGIAMAVTSQEKIGGLTNLLQGLYEVLMKIIDFAMKLAPYGVAGLIFATASKLGLQIISTLFLYVAVVIGALLFHFLVTYGVIIKYALKRSPAAFFRDISEVIITAFSTSSSNATLPTSIRTSVEKLKLDKDISNFVLTVGSTANQNGTALMRGLQFCSLHSSTERISPVSGGSASNNRNTC